MNWLESIHQAPEGATITVSITYTKKSPKKAKPNHVFNAAALKIAEGQGVEVKELDRLVKDGEIKVPKSGVIGVNAIKAYFDGLKDKEDEARLEGLNKTDQRIAEEPKEEPKEVEDLLAGIL